MSRETNQIPQFMQPIVVVAYPISVNEKRIQFVGEEWFGQFSEEHLQQAGHHVHVTPPWIAQIQLKISIFP